MGAASACGLIRGAARVETAGRGRLHPESTPGQPGRRRAARPTASYVDIVLRSFVTRKDAATGAGLVDVTRVIDIVRAVLLLVVIITVSAARPQPGTDGVRGAAIAVTLGLSVAAWIVWMLAGPRRWMMVGGLVVMGAAGGALAGSRPTARPSSSAARRRSARASG